MLTNQNVKFVVMLSTKSQNRGSTTTEVLDTAGYNEALIVYNLGDMSPSGLAQGFEIQESDDNSVWTSIDQATVGNAACVGIDGTAITAADITTQDSVLVFNLDLAKRKRYLRCEINNGLGNNRFSCYALLGVPSNLGDINSAKMVLSFSTGTEAYVRVPVGG